MAEIDKTGLDILCTGPGDTYLPPKGGLSACIFADGTVLVCDSKTDTCTRSLTQGSDKASALDGVMTHRLLKLVKALSERVDRLESKIAGRRP
jgi:hypothetical protein